MFDCDPPLLQIAHILSHITISNIQTHAPHSSISVQKFSCHQVRGRRVYRQQKKTKKKRERKKREKNKTTTNYMF